MGDKRETWIKCYRSFLDWEWYKNNNTKILFFHLLLIVNIKPQKKEGIIIPVGSIDRTQEQLMHELGFTRQQLRTAISNLEKTKEITKDDKGKFTVFTVVRWSDYQAHQPKNNQETNQGITKDQPKINHLNKNNKEYKEEKEINSSNEQEEDWDSLPVLSYLEVEKWEAEHGRQWEGITQW